MNIVFHHISSWKNFSSGGFHNRSGNIFLQLRANPSVEKILFVHSGPFWMVDRLQQKKGTYFPLGNVNAQLRKIDEKVTLFECRKLLPFDRFGMVNRFNAWWSAQRIRKAIRSLSRGKWISWFYHPVLANQVIQSSSGPIVYDSLESIIGHTQYKLSPNHRLLESYDLLCKKSDIIFCVAEKMIDLLEEKFGRERSKTIWISNGVRFGDYQRERRDMPEEYKDIPKPIIGYIGVVNDYTDLDLLEFLVRQRPHYSFVLVGKTLGDTDISRIMNYSNVYLIPFKPPEMLPDYISGFDVCINIYRNNDIVNTGDSIKMYNFLAAGKPIVSTNVQRIDRFKEFVYIADDPDAFLTYLDRAVTEGRGDESIIQHRINAAARHDWSSKTGEMLSILKNYTVSENAVDRKQYVGK